ncbi:hypothetical protein CGI93_23600, partial [Vibrio parahaemolyticus]|uniref:ATP-binding protein n=1 Tax=Vibrio parahaemolyticus TaxID=670 RepID=UPI001121FAF0
MIEEIKCINDLILSDDVRNKLNTIMKVKNGFYLFYSSETGTGKTTAANLISRDVSKSTSNDGRVNFKYYDCTDVNESKLFKNIDDMLFSHNLNGSKRIVVLDEVDK